MRDSGRLLWLVTGMVLGAAGFGLYLGQVKPVQAANDRYEDYIMCTGTVSTAVLGRSHLPSPADTRRAKSALTFF